MSVEQSKAVVRRFIQATDKGNLGVIDALVSPDYVHHCNERPVWHGSDGTKESCREWLAAFPDMQTTIRDLFGENDRVAVRALWRGTHTDTMWGHPATGRLVQATQMVIYRLKGGQLVASWEEWDAKGFFEQLAGTQAG